MLRLPIVSTPNADIAPGISSVSTTIPFNEKARCSRGDTIVPPNVPMPAATSAATKIHSSPPPRLIDNASRKVRAPSAARIVATAGTARRMSKGVSTRITALSTRGSIAKAGMRAANTAAITKTAAATSGSHLTPTSAISPPPTAVPTPPARVPVRARCPLAATNSVRSGTSWATIAVFANAYALRDSKMPKTNG